MSVDQKIEFKFGYSAGETQKLEQALCRLLECHGYKDNTIQTQLMILRELIISGEKLDGCKRSEADMTVHLHIENDSITVEVNKPIDESVYDRLQELDNTIQWIRGCQDPLAPGMLRPAETVDTAHSDQTNGFALARLAQKENAIIDFYVSEDNILKLSAVRKLNAESINVG